MLLCAIVLPAEAAQKPVADLSVSKTSGDVPLTVTFTDKSTGGKALWKWWSFGDGGWSDSTANTITHTYTKPGKYTVFLKATNKAGTSTKTYPTPIIVGQKPVADFSVTPTSGNAPLKVTFTDKSTGGKALWKWWGFGDRTGSDSTANTIEHTYKKEGTYKVFLKATNAADSDISDFQYITVFPTIKDKGTVSKVSWGETSSIYPTQNNLYKPSKWDQTKTCELLKARAGIQLVSTRNSNVRKASPSNTAIDNILKPYHYIENFPSVDSEISDSKVKWFYISKSANKPTVHPGVKDSKLVKSYGPFYNVGGGDVPKGNVYINFYKK